MAWTETALPFCTENSLSELLFIHVFLTRLNLYEGQVEQTRNTAWTL